MFLIPTDCSHHQSQGFLGLRCHHELTRSDILARVGRRTDLQWPFHLATPENLSEFTNFINFLYVPSEIFKHGLDTWTSTISEVFHNLTCDDHMASIQLCVRSREEIVRAECIVFQRWDNFSHSSLHSLTTSGQHSTFSGASVDVQDLAPAAIGDCPSI